MRILIIGPTGSGKSTAAEFFSTEFDFQTYSMSKMFRESYPEKSMISLTAFSKKLLNENPNVNIEYIQNHFGSEVQYIDKVIFEGFRNPEEFIKFLNKETIVIILKPSFKTFKDDFEEFGVLACENVAMWKKENGDIKDALIAKYDSFEELQQWLKND